MILKSLALTVGDQPLAKHRLGSLLVLGAPGRNVRVGSEGDELRRQLEKVFVEAILLLDVGRERSLVIPQPQVQTDLQNRCDGVVCAHFHPKSAHLAIGTANQSARLLLGIDSRTSHVRNQPRSQRRRFRIFFPSHGSLGPGEKIAEAGRVVSRAKGRFPIGQQTIDRGGFKSLHGKKRQRRDRTITAIIHRFSSFVNSSLLLGSPLLVPTRMAHPITHIAETPGAKPSRCPDFHRALRERFEIREIVDLQVFVGKSAGVDRIVVVLPLDIRFEELDSILRIFHPIHQGEHCSRGFGKTRIPLGAFLTILNQLGFHFEMPKVIQDGTQVVILDRILALILSYPGDSFLEIVRAFDSPREIDSVIPGSGIRLGLRESEEMIESPATFFRFAIGSAQFHPVSRHLVILGKQAG